MTYSPQELSGLRHSSEQSRFLIALVVLVPLFIALIIVLLVTFGLALIYLALLLFVFWLAMRTVVASYLGNMILATNVTFAEVTSAVAAAKKRFAYDGHIDAFVYQEGSYNMILHLMLGRKVLLINSELLKPGNSDIELRFIVGRFIGSLASKHYRFAWVQVFLGSIEKLAVFNIFLYPYERAVVYSGDQMGLAFIDGDVASAIRAMLKMVVGSEIAVRVNAISFAGQGVVLRGSFFGWLARAYSSFPHQVHRVDNLLRFSQQRFPDQTRRFLSETGDQASALAAQ